MRLDFACGHSLTVADDAAIEPRCILCRDGRITHVQIRPPRFRGACTGPHAEFNPEIGQPGAVNLAPGGPLKLKDTDHGDE